MEAKYAVKNGELIKAEDASISVFNKSMFFDFAVYSNIKVNNGKMFLPDFEIEKLFESAKDVALEHEFTKKQIFEWANLLIEKNNLKDALIRLLLIGADKKLDSILFLFPVGLTYYPDKLYKKGAKLVSYKGERYFPTSKTKNLLINYIAYREASKNDAIDALLIGNDGNISEGTRSSFFAIRGKTLIAPPKEKVLEGITRKIIMEIAPKILEIKEENIQFNKIKEYDEFFITGTTLKVMPINQIDDVIVKSDFSKTRQLQKLFDEYCKNQ